MSIESLVLPNKGNLWTGYVIFGGFILVTLVGGVFKGIFLSSGLWKGTLVMFIPLIWMTAFIKAQKVILRDNSITHTKLGFFKINRKEFKIADLEYWKIDKLTLVIVTKGATAPKLPHGFFEDLGKVMLIPTSLFMPRTKEILDYLVEKGVPERK